ncbi:MULTISPECIES: prephenate dehydratase [Prochlorococcus]|uniref:prephenate dehydratase n=1 Tax=Prochlorococcus TaxID=1218 RepID=UPI000533AF1E|nr:MULTISPECIES: prephenate dehydratase [Prochlorococcus]KGG13532.1 Prephenate dehydratase [Prochlorococcus sp. MIT 0601]
MPTKVAYLGPKGSYAEKAAFALAKLEKHDAATFLPCLGIRSVIENVATKHCEAAVVPIENSVEGGVTTTLDALWNHPNLFIKRALVIPIRHALISNGSLKEISEVLSHPQALAQCSTWLSTNLPDALQLPTSSTSEAVRMVKGSKFRAAIGSSKAASEIGGLNQVAYPINDVPGNCTRFVFLQNIKNETQGAVASIAFSLHSNTPGSLLNVLKCIANLGLNMSRIESRPSKRELGEYIFFIDIEIDNTSRDINEKLCKALKPLCENIINFGSYESTELNLESI